jgi:hypothetical protein
MVRGAEVNLPLCFLSAVTYRKWLTRKRRGNTKMCNTSSHNKGYVLAAVLGAIGGGLIVALATRAIPKMMSGMMRNMMAQMREGGCAPAEM